MKSFILMLLMFSISACAGKESFPTIPSGIQATKIEDVVNNPAAYDGKTILLIGTVGDFCCPSGSHLIFQDSGESIDIYSKGFKFPKFKKGQPIKVYAEVKVGEKNLVFSAVGLEVR